MPSRLLRGSQTGRSADGGQGVSFLESVLRELTAHEGKKTQMGSLKCQAQPPPPSCEKGRRRRPAGGHWDRPKASPNLGLRVTHLGQRGVSDA